MSARKIDILIVEDNPYDSELTMLAAKQGNKKANLIHIRDGPEALNFLHQQISEENNLVIVLDLSLPRSDGFDILKDIRKNKSTKLTPVVILSGSEEEDKIEEAYALGANSYVIKPTGFDEYIKFVSSITYFWSVVNTQPGDWNLHHYQPD